MLDDVLDSDPAIAASFAMSEAVIGPGLKPIGRLAPWSRGKFGDLVACSGVTCLAGSSIGRVCAEGFKLPDDHVDRRLAFPGAVPAPKKSPIEAGKPPELPWLWSRMCELGASHGIDMPAKRAFVAALAPFVNCRRSDTG